MPIVLRIEVKFALISLVLGSAIGFFTMYAQRLNLISPPQNSILEWQITSIASLVVMYPITLLVFYRFGRIEIPKFRLGLSLIVTYLVSFAGETVGQSAVILVARSSTGFPSYFIYFPNLNNSFTFLFVAFSGLAFARLRSGKTLESNTSPWSYAGIALIMLSFFFVPNFWFGVFEFLWSGVNFSFTFVAVEFGLFLLPILQLLIFYYTGRKVSIVGRPFTFFGMLFVGAYLGAVLGSVVSVALFGQSHWSIPPNQNLFTMEYGIVFHNIPPSPLLILESLIPVQSLPFLAFFAMSIPRFRSENPGSLLDDHPEDLVAMKSDSVV